MPLPVVAAVAALAAIAGKAGYGASQIAQAKKIRAKDTTPDAFKEALALTRQQAASQQVPGAGAEYNRLLQGQAAAVQQARLGAGSSADFLAASAGADGRRQQGMEKLGAMGMQYRDRATQQLGQRLAQLADFQRADQDRADQARAALRGAGQANIWGAANDGATFAAYAATNKNGNTTATPASTTPPTPAANSTPTFGSYDGLTPAQLMRQMRAENAYYQGQSY